MKLRFKNQDFQTAAVNAVADLFAGQEHTRSTFSVMEEGVMPGQTGMFQSELGVGNALRIDGETLTRNMRAVQRRNLLQQTESANSRQFCVEMETGTGKTYVYTKTIFELNRRYGFTKFIVVVPSVAIREGVYKSFEVTREHFGLQYDNVPCRYFIYTSAKLADVRQFATSANIEIVYNFKMGVAGAAIATDIAQAASCAAAFFYMMRKYSLFHWRWGEFTFEWRLAKRALKSGFPMALQQFIVSVGFVFIQRAVNSYGEAMTASFTVAQKVETYMILPANALMTTQGTYTGQNIGAGRTDRVITGAKHTVILSEIISTCILIVAFIFAKPIVTAFGLEIEAIGYCTAHVRCIAICLIPFASYFPLLGLF